MRLIELSDHPGGMLQDIHRQRLLAEQSAQSEYADARARHEARLDQARADRAEAIARHRWWTWIRAIFAVWAERRRAPRRPVLVSGPTDREESIAAGIAGERQIAVELGQVFGDEWVLFRGYRNRRGEIDHLLLGPRGLFAIEVKYRNATVYINGDHWQFEKFDQWGNRVEQGSIEDRTGRSPSMQLNEPADDLEKFLRSRRQPVSIIRIVILNHPRSRVGRSQHLTVYVTTSSEYIVGLVNDSRVELPGSRLAQLERLIERDHRFHDGRRPPR
jgi:Nuclease-related domain